MDNSGYILSTQNRHYSFTPTELSSLRKHTLELSLTPLASPPALTAHHTLKILTHYTLTLSKLCHHFGVPSAVRGTAITILHRLYLHLSPVTTHPKTLLLPILLLAMKTELGGTSISQFIRTAEEVGLSTTKKELQSPELMIAAGLRWSLTVRHPWRGLDGAMVVLIREFGDQEDARIRKASQKARQWLTGDCFMTDAGFLYTPSQLLWAALWAQDQELIDRYMKGRFSDEVAEKIKECADVFVFGTRKIAGCEEEAIRWGGAVNEKELVSEAKVGDRMVHLARKELDQGRKRAEEEALGREAEERERRKKKRKMEMEKMKADDVFGPAL
ncbi:hypothetical protein EX30DRAFT_338819 [Ascodesmis nigricans]|uniref:Cyclin C-terminal domain-containing protein n=1 Tax=Ascodesmis nigricans TaxID=341454 RepID=A0A4S2N582_9PEZI|nr:hypothetical protein EX30DRAFT_338819 [Ascodesmis nigricans]